MRTKHITVQIDLDRVRASAEEIGRRTRVAVVAVVKADAYGLGALRVCDAISSAVNEFAYFYASEAREVGRGGLVIGPPDGTPDDYRELRLRPTIGTIADAERFRGMPIAVNIDTGMQRFGCEPDEIERIAACASIPEYHTHAASIEQVRKLVELCEGRKGRRMAASSSLISEPSAWLDGVRPGVSLYRGAMRVSSRIVAVRDLTGPAGYTRFESRRVGIMLGGYSNHLQSAPVLVNGRRQMMLEVGMNTCFVSLDPADKVGDEVVLLGDGLSEADVAKHLSIREHEVLCRYGSSGNRVYGTRG